MRDKSAKILLDTLEIYLLWVEPDIINIALKGELDALVYEDVLEFTKDNLTSEEKAVIIDAKDLAYMDSSGIKYLSFLTSRFGAENVAVFKANIDLKRLILLVGFDRKVAFLDDQKELEEWRPPERRAA